MFTSLATDKGGGVSGMASWFSSLRRQPKNKKQQDKKSMQKSCVDLTTNNIYYDVPPVRVVPASPTKSHVSDINIEDTATKCTCDITTTTNVETTRMKSQSRSSDCQKVPKIISDSATTTTETNSRSIYSVRNKEEFRTTTTTKITKTTVVNRQQTYRVGLIFDEDGELMNSNLDLWQLASRCKSRERLVFDTSGKRIPTNANNNNIHTLNNNNLSSSSNYSNEFLSNEQCDSSINLLNDENIEFIDCTNAGDDIYNTERSAQTQTQCKNCKNKSKNVAKSKSETHLNQTNKVIFKINVLRPLT
jgi:cytohesin